jgi:hypothetical protein
VFAFHEKAVRIKRFFLFFLLNKFFLPPGRHSRHPSDFTNSADFPVIGEIASVERTRFPSKTTKSGI